MPISEKQWLEIFNGPKKFFNWVIAIFCFQENGVEYLAIKSYIYHQSMITNKLREELQEDLIKDINSVTGTVGIHLLKDAFKKNKINLSSLGYKKFKTEEEHLDYLSEFINPVNEERATWRIYRTGTVSKSERKD